MIIVMKETSNGKKAVVKTLNHEGERTAVHPLNRAMTYRSLITKYAKTIWIAGQIQQIAPLIKLRLLREYWAMLVPLRIRYSRRANAKTAQTIPVMVDALR